MDTSIVELIFYGFIELFSLSMLIISVIKEIPDTKSRSIARAVYLIPGMIAAGVMSGTGIHINMITTMTNSTTISNVTQEVFTEIGTKTDMISLVNPMWMMFHLLIFLTLLIFILNQVYNLLVKTD